MRGTVRGIIATTTTNNPQTQTSSSRGNCKGTWGWEWGVGWVNAPKRILSFGIYVVVCCFVVSVVVAVSPH